jgi:ATP-binding cassette subfamily F protein 3
MHLVKLDQIAVNHAGRTIFEGLTWAIGERDRAGLVGPNGAGKSSLLQLIAGDGPAEAGVVTRIPGLRIGLLPQTVALPPGATVLTVASALPPHLARIEGAMAAINDRLANPAVYGVPEKLAHVLNEQAALVEAFAEGGGDRFQSTAREALAYLGFSPEDYDTPVEVLSGGQKKLVALAGLAASSPGLLLLDEPDNHLDLNGKRRLEAFIRRYPGAVVVVTHDRYLLDETVTLIAELERGQLTLYPGDYSTYAIQREKRRMRQAQLYTAQQKEIARIEEAIKRFELWASIVVDERHIRQARSRRKMLDRMRENGEIIDPVNERRKMGLNLEGWRGSKEALKAESLAMGFDGDLIFMEVDFLIRHGERVGLIGPNGSGKSLLVRLILGQLEPLEGQIKVGPSTRIGYFAQEFQTLAPWLDRTPLHFIRDVKPMREEDAVAFLAKFLFSYAQSSAPIRELSGGERGRLQLAALMLQGPNLLILDEPTNNLDIDSAEVLEEVLRDFEGAILIVSHDRYLMDRIADRLLLLEEGTMRDFAGDYSALLAEGGIEKMHQ